LFNYEILFNHATTPIYVTEGALDALSIGTDMGVGLTDSNLSDWKIKQLQQAAHNRKIVFVCDKNNNGYKVGTQALRAGFAVTVMPNGVADSNDCRIRFGHLWLLAYLAKNAQDGVGGELLLRMNCT
jgi:hypothetical protein